MPSCITCVLLAVAVLPSADARESLIIDAEGKEIGNSALVDKDHRSLFRTRVTGVQHQHTGEAIIDAEGLPKEVEAADAHDKDTPSMVRPHESKDSAGVLLAVKETGTDVSAHGNQQDSSEMHDAANAKGAKDAKPHASMADIKKVVSSDDFSDAGKKVQDVRPDQPAPGIVNMPWLQHVVPKAWLQHLQELGLITVFGLAFSFTIAVGLCIMVYLKAKKPNKHHLDEDDLLRSAAWKARAEQREAEMKG